MKLVKRTPRGELVPWAEFEPWREFRDLEDRLERIFGELVPRWPGAHPVHTWEPAVDVYENDTEFVLKAELPEVEEKDVHVNLEGNILTIKGERRHEAEVKKEHYHRTERFFGSFERSFALPDTVDRDRIKATFKAGVMTLTLPKKEGVKPKEIAIETGK